MSSFTSLEQHTAGIERLVASQTTYIAQLEQEKRQLCEVIAMLILEQGGTITVTSLTQQRFHPKMQMQVMRLSDGSMEYKVKEN